MSAEPANYTVIKCDECGREFTGRDRFDGHIRFLEGELIPEPCPGGTPA